MKQPPQNLLQFCPCCATSLQAVPVTDLNFCYKCGTNMRAIRLAIGFVQQPQQPEAQLRAPRIKTTDDKIIQVRELRAAGKTVAYIAQTLHLAKSTVSLYARPSYDPKVYAPRSKKRTLVTDELIAQVLSMSDKKKYQVALDLGISRATVERIRRRHTEETRAALNGAEVPAPV